MRKRTAASVVSFLILFSMGSCIPNEPEFYPQELIEGYVPVYGISSAAMPAMLEPRPVNNPGKIYVYDKYLLVNEIDQGIHVFDNTDPAEPMPVGFLQLLGNTDMAIKDGLLYADHLGNLVALSVQDFSAIEERGRLPLMNWKHGVPPPMNAYFECVDPTKGVVVFWESAELRNPECYAVR